MTVASIKKAVSSIVSVPCVMTCRKITGQAERRFVKRGCEYLYAFLGHRFNCNKDWSTYNSICSRIFGAEDHVGQLGDPENDGSVHGLRTDVNDLRSLDIRYIEKVRNSWAGGRIRRRQLRGLDLRARWRWEGEQEMRSEELALDEGSNSDDSSGVSS